MLYKRFLLVWLNCAELPAVYKLKDATNNLEVSQFYSIARCVYIAELYMTNTFIVYSLHIITYHMHRLVKVVFQVTT